MRRSKTKKTLWVVTEVFYAKKLILGQKSTFGLGAKVQLQIPGAVPGSGNINISKDNHGSWVVNAASGSHVPFALKMTKLVFKDTGELAEIDAYMKKRAERRGEEDEDLKKAFNPEKDPDFHMRELFSPEPSPEGSSNDTELECLVEFT